ncbi:MAG: DNA primase [Candidatus Omnitrophica bacterium]|nr:DNA primase [Candidatus Omnitrophota bacterium]
MANYIPENILDDILSRIDIVELISGYFPLKRAGRNLRALCPFHHEKTPSFMVNPQKQIFHCFGCGKGGNVVSFLMEYERMDFIEAVKTLARKTGVELPKNEASSKSSGLITSLYKVNEFAVKFYRDFLNSASGAAARTYLSKRSLSNDTVNLFQLGLSPDKWEGLFNYLRTKNASPALLEKSGLVSKGQNQGYYDRFRKRLVFPIFDVKSRVLALGARLLEDAPGMAKYINSPESLIYVKGRHLYGLNLTREAIRKEDYAIVVEGYFDCISVFQAGIKNVVASLGTSLTAEQIRLIKRYTRNVIMVYDSDQAGQDATLRSLDMFIQEDMNTRVAILPVNFDPDSFLRKFEAKAFRHILDNALGLFDYKLGLLSSRYKIINPENKAFVAGAMLDSIKKIRNPILQAEYLRRLAQALDIKEEVLISELRKIKDQKPYDFREFFRIPDSKINPTERLLMRLILGETELITKIKSVLSPEDFQDARIARVFSLICELISKGKDIEPKCLIGYLDDRESASLISEILAADEHSQEDSEEILNDCVSKIKKQRLNLRCQSLREEIKLAQKQGDQGHMDSLVFELRDLLRSGSCLEEVK